MLNIPTYKRSEIEWQFIHLSQYLKYVINVQTHNASEKLNWRLGEIRFYPTIAGQLDFETWKRVKNKATRGDYRLHRCLEQMVYLSTPRAIGKTAMQNFLRFSPREIWN